MTRLTKKKIMRIAAPIVGLLIVCIMGIVLVFMLSTPSNDRDWSLDQALLPQAVFDGDMVTIKNIRNFTYTTRFDYTPAYYDRTFDLRTIKSVDYIVEPLASVAAAHTFLSFGFENGEYVSISIEIRKERDERFSPFLALFDQYELMYVIVDERDTIKLRALYRNDPVYLYPITMSQDMMRPLFVDMLRRANQLAEHPEFYNTVTNTCATNIADHVNKLLPGRIPWDMRLILPMNSDKFAYELGLIDTSVPFPALRASHLINDHIKKYADDPHFSVKIREAIQK